MGATRAPQDPTRPTIAISLAEPERSELDAALTEAGYNTIQLQPGESIVEAFSASTPTLIAIVDVAGDPEGTVTRVEEARRGRAGHLSVMFLAGEAELDGL